MIVSSSPKHNPTFNLHSGLKEFKRLKQELTWVGVWEGKVADAGFLKKRKKEKDLVCFYPQLDSVIQKSNTQQIANSRRSMTVITTNKHHKYYKRTLPNCSSHVGSSGISQHCLTLFTKRILHIKNTMTIPPSQSDSPLSPTVWNDEDK